MNYAAIVYNDSNVIVNVCDRPSLELAIKAGEFFSRDSGYWYYVETTPELIDLAKFLINA